MRPRTRTPLLLAALLLVAFLDATLAFAAGELIKNGLLSEGSDGVPAAWSHEGYAEKPPATEYTWKKDDTGIGVLEMSSSQPNDARWVQNVPVSPSTWYEISGFVRAENVGAQSMGVYLSVMDTFYNSRDLRGTVGWQPVSLWVKTGRIETSLRVACRLGGYSSLNTGVAQCTGISVAASGTPKPGDAFVYGGSPDERASGELPIAKGVAVLVAVGVVLLLWRYLAPPAVRTPP